MTIACFIPTISVGSTLTHVRFYYLDDPVHLLGFATSSINKNKESAAEAEKKDGEVLETKQSGYRAAKPIRGSEAVIIRTFDDGTRDRPYGHCLVAGIKKYPSKVVKRDSAKKTAKKSHVKAFVKMVNYQHVMPTRYMLDVDLKDAVTVESLQAKDKKVAALKETKKRLEERFKTGKNCWFFTKLRF
ncbi:hypothetical protein AAHE18_11G195900 [Arachis hypogaea]